MLRMQEMTKWTVYQLMLEAIKYVLYVCAYASCHTQAYVINTDSEISGYIENQET